MLLNVPVRRSVSGRRTNERPNFGVDNVKCIDPRLSRRTKSAAHVEDGLTSASLVDSGEDADWHPWMERRHNERGHAGANEQSLCGIAAKSSAPTTSAPASQAQKVRPFLICELAECGRRVAGQYIEPYTIAADQVRQCP
jgi:hypothetical protein